MLRWISQAHGENSKVVFVDEKNQKNANQLLDEIKFKFKDVDSNTKLVMIAQWLEQLGET